MNAAAGLWAWRLAELWAFVTAICAVADAVFPVPRPGSRWISLRTLVSTLGANAGFAVNRILPGSVEATVTAADVLETVHAQHVEAEESRRALARKIDVASKTPVVSIAGRLSQIDSTLEGLRQMLPNRGAPP